MKLSNIKAGDHVATDSGFTCMQAAAHVIEADDTGLFIRCEHGKHYLDGQQTAPGSDLIGISRLP